MAQEETIARAVEKGADDYVVKPFSPMELMARIKTALREQEAPEWAEPSEPFVLGKLTIDYAERRVTLAGRPVALTATESGLLFELSVNAGRVLTYHRLLRRVWGLRRSADSRRLPDDEGEGAGTEGAFEKLTTPVPFRLLDPPTRLGVHYTRKLSCRSGGAMNTALCVLSYRVCARGLHVYRQFIY